MLSNNLNRITATYTNPNVVLDVEINNLCSVKLSRTSNLQNICRIQIKILLCPTLFRTLVFYYLSLIFNCKIMFLISNKFEL